MFWEVQVGLPGHLASQKWVARLACILKKRKLKVRDNVDKKPDLNPSPSPQTPTTFVDRVKYSIAATIMNNGDSYSSRGMASSLSSAKVKHEESVSTDKKSSTDNDRHGSSRDYPVSFSYS
jgi:hypothetical protein